MNPAEVDALRAWIAAARGAVEWHLETGDAELTIPEDWRPPPLGRIAPDSFTAPAALAASGPSVAEPAAPEPERTREGFTALKQAIGAVVQPPTRAPRPAFGGAEAMAAVGAAAEPGSAADAPVEVPAADAPGVSVPAGGSAGAAAALRVIQDDLGDCRRCALSQGRTEIVFGAGHPQARIMFVADQPGAAEDGTGLPFVDGSGQLLGRMVRAMGLTRSQVYLTYLVKCHDPEQGPEPGLEPCGAFLDQQVAAVQPEVIVALGDLAARRLTGQDLSLPHLRGKWYDRGGVPVLATFHPHALQQYPESKRQVWNDLKQAMRKLGLPLPRRGR